MLPAIILLACWRVVYGFLQLKRARKPWRKIIRHVMLRTVAVFLAGIILVRAALLLYLFLSFFKAIYHAMRNWREDINNKLFRITIWLHAGALIALGVVIAASYIQMARLDQIQIIKKYVWRGTIPEAYIVKKIAGDPTFEISRLRKMIVSSNERDSELAFKILWRRESLYDLLFLKDVILNHQDLDRALSRDFSANSIYFQYWLESVGVKKYIKTKENLEEWIEETENKRGDENTGSQ